MHDEHSLCVSWYVQYQQEKKQYVTDVRARSYCEQTTFHACKLRELS